MVEVRRERNPDIVHQDVDAAEAFQAVGHRGGHIVGGGRIAAPDRASPPSDSMTCIVSSAALRLMSVPNAVAP
jgi:hypothetical protein